MEVAGWKQGTTNEPQPEDAVLFFSFDGACERPLVVPLAFSHVLSPRLLVTSKITTRKTYVKECMTSTQNTDRATYKSTTTQTQCADALSYSMHFFNLVFIVS